MVWIGSADLLQEGDGAMASQNSIYGAAASERPFIARVHEVQSNEELERASLEQVPDEPVVSSVHGIAKDTPAVSIGPEETVSGDLASDDTAEASPLPFVGRALHYVPGQSIIVERRLNLAEDLYLADHAFIHAPGVKPDSACLPVQPMTVSLEVMAEAAACLVPGNGLLGFEDVKAARWIELADTDNLTLEVKADVKRYDAERGAWFIAVSVRAEGQNWPAITATVLFGERYLVELSPTFSELTNAYRYTHTGEEIYADRHMFHGPRFHCLSGDIIIGDNGLVGEFLRRSPEDLFRSRRDPQLLTDPALLDAVGQIMGVWAMANDRYAFPIGLKKLEFYCPTPPVGARLPVRVEIIEGSGKRLLANVEVQDGSGNVWMRIEEWGSWKFAWDRRLVDFRRFPDRYLLARDAGLPGLDEGAVGLTLSTDDVQGFDFGMLARHCLGMEEMPLFHGHAAFPKRQQEWVLGRAVAKDAVRHWLSQRTGSDMLHPAAFSIASDANGRPFVNRLPGAGIKPSVSIAHSQSRAIAVAYDGDVGVDIEVIAERDESFLTAFTTASEREMLTSFPPEERPAWVTRFWCAKEAAGKLRGTGVNGAPQTFEVVGVTLDGQIQIQHRSSSETISVRTVENQGFIIAYAKRPRPA